MPADKPRIIEIRDFIVPGYHDALLEVLALHNRKAGNQMMLSISEACLPKWPLNMSDYEPAPEVLHEKTRIKVTIREDRHPGLFRLYRSIGLGSKGKIFLNMFNRHQLMKVEDPEGVNEAVTKMHEQLIAKMSDEGFDRVGQGAQIKHAHADFGPQPRSIETRADEQKQKGLEEDEPATKTEAIETLHLMADPLTTIAPMKF